jgi:hypothetical protein
MTVDSDMLITILLLLLSTRSICFFFFKMWQELPFDKLTRKYEPQSCNYCFMSTPDLLPRVLK